MSGEHRKRRRRRRKSSRGAAEGELVAPLHHDDAQALAAARSTKTDEFSSPQALSQASGGADVAIIDELVAFAHAHGDFELSRAELANMVGARCVQLVVRGAFCFTHARARVRITALVSFARTLARALARALALFACASAQRQEAPRGRRAEHE